MTKVVTTIFCNGGMNMTLNIASSLPDSLSYNKRNKNKYKYK